MGAEK